MVISPQGALLGNLEGVCREFWEKGKVYLGSFLGPRWHSDFKFGGHVELGKSTGLTWADTRLWGTKGLSIRS